MKEKTIYVECNDDTVDSACEWMSFTPSLENRFVFCVCLCVCSEAINVEQVLFDPVES